MRGRKRKFHPPWLTLAAAAGHLHSNLFSLFSFFLTRSASRLENCFFRNEAALRIRYFAKSPIPTFISVFC